MTTEKAALRISPEAYLQERVEYKINLYYKLSKQSKHRYYAISVASIILSAAVPILINVKAAESLLPIFPTLLTTILSLMVTILVALEKLFQFREHRKNYDLAEESLRREKFLFQTRAGDYKGLNDEEAFTLFASRFEDRIHQERTQTIETRAGEGKSAV